MNILNDKQRENLEIVGQKEIAKGQYYLATLKLQPGQKVWELDLNNKTIREAQYEQVDINLHEGLVGKIHKKIIRKPDHWYVEAINKRNADKKFGQMILKKLASKI